MADIEIADEWSRLKDVVMSRTRRSFTTEHKVEADHRVIDSGRRIAEVARELGVNEGLLARLRKQVAEQERDNAFLKNGSACFAANQPK